MKIKNATLYLCICLLLGINGWFLVHASDGTNGTNQVQKQHEYPERLLRAVEVFKSAMSTNRVGAAFRLCGALPRCPPINIGASKLEGIDVSKPSYILSTNDIIALLGQPSDVIGANSSDCTYHYSLRKGSEGYLWIRFDSNQVIASGIYSGVY